MVRMACRSMLGSEQAMRVKALVYIQGTLSRPRRGMSFSSCGVKGHAWPEGIRNRIEPAPLVSRDASPAPESSAVAGVGPAGLDMRQPYDGTVRQINDRPSLGAGLGR